MMGYPEARCWTYKTIEVKKQTSHPGSSRSPYLPGRSPYEGLDPSLVSKLSHEDRAQLLKELRARNQHPYLPGGLRLVPVKLVKWMFLPTCKKPCDVPTPTSGTADMTFVRVTYCTSRTFARFPVEKCTDTITYGLKK